MAEVWTGYYQPDYPVRRSTFYRYESFSGSIFRAQIDAPGIERDGTINLSSFWLNLLRHVGTSYGVNASSGVDASSDVRDAALSGVGGGTITVVHGQGSGAPGWIGEQTVFGNINWGNSNGLNSVPAYITTDGMLLDAPGAPDDWIDVEFHPDDVPDPTNETADSGEVLDAWLSLAWKSAAGEVDRDPFNSQYHATLPTIGETTDGSTWATPVFTESSGTVLDGSFDLPLNADGVWDSQVLEFPSLAARLAAIRDTGETAGVLPVSLGSNAITSTPDPWDDALGAQAVHKLVAPTTFLVQDVLWRPPRIRFLIEQVGHWSVGMA